MPVSAHASSYATLFRFTSSVLVSVLARTRWVRHRPHVRLGVLGGDGSTRARVPLVGIYGVLSFEEVVSAGGATGEGGSGRWRAFKDFMRRREVASSDYIAGDLAALRRC